MGDLVDQRLPGSTYPAGEDQFAPAIHEEGAVHEGFDVLWASLSNDGLVCTEALPTVGQVDPSITTRPVEVEWELHTPERLPGGQLRQLVGDACRAASTDRNLSPSGPADNRQTMAGGIEDALGGVEGGRDVTVLVGRERGARGAAPASQLGPGQSGSSSSLSQQFVRHEATVSDQIRIRKAAGATPAP